MIAGGTPGTRHTLTNAYRRGIPVVIVTPDGHIATDTPTQPLEDAIAEDAGSDLLESPGLQDRDQLRRQADR